MKLPPKHCEKPLTVRQKKRKNKLLNAPLKKCIKCEPFQEIRPQQNQQFERGTLNAEQILPILHDGDRR
jgi:hypothetical protein